MAQNTKFDEHKIEVMMSEAQQAMFDFKKSFHKLESDGRKINFSEAANELIEFAIALEDKKNTLKWYVANLVSEYNTD